MFIWVKIPQNLNLPNYQMVLLYKVNILLFYLKNLKDNNEDIMHIHEWHPDKTLIYEKIGNSKKTLISEKVKKCNTPSLFDKILNKGVPTSVPTSVPTPRSYTCYLHLFLHILKIVIKEIIIIKIEITGGRGRGRGRVRGRGAKEMEEVIMIKEEVMSESSGSRSR